MRLILLTFFVVISTLTFASETLEYNRQVLTNKGDYSTMLSTLVIAAILGIIVLQLIRNGNKTTTARRKTKYDKSYFQNLN